jgi:hypothetical protein
MDANRDAKAELNAAIRLALTGLLKYVVTVFPALQAGLSHLGLSALYQECSADAFTPVAYAQELRSSPLTDRWRICSRLTPRLAQESAAVAAPLAESASFPTVW